MSKSETAAKVVKTFNSDFNVIPVVNRMQPKTENFFTDVYWDSLDFVVNAVDNIKAR